MKQFTYKIKIALPSTMQQITNEVEFLNKEGNEGWELVGVTQNSFQLVYFFKRELRQDSVVDDSLIPYDLTPLV